MAEERSTPQAVSPGSVGSVRLMGVPIRLHFTFVLLLIFLVVIGLGSDQSPANYILFILAMIASVLLHELGHAFVSSRYGIRTLEIVMFPIGGVARTERPAKTLGRILGLDHRSVSEPAHRGADSRRSVRAK